MRTLTQSTPRIRGLVLPIYPVASIEDVDSHLSDLRRWLVAALDSAPEFSLDYVKRFNTDVNRLLDARLALMGLTK